MKILIIWVIALIIGFTLAILFNKSQKKIESEHYLNSPEDEIEERRR